MNAVMDLSKSYDFFQPDKYSGRIHIVGCGSVGSVVAADLARCGVTKITLWDFDTVESHNIVNQRFRQQDIGNPKVEALRDILLEINPEIADSIKLQPKGWHGEMMSGFIFLCVDSIEVRKEIVRLHMNNMSVQAVFDFRTMLTGAQHYAADWSDMKQKQSLLNSMDFTSEEADVDTPVSACGITLGVVTTVELISAFGVNNYINFVKGNGFKKFVMLDGFNFTLDAC